MSYLFVSNSVVGFEWCFRFDESVSKENRIYCCYESREEYSKERKEIEEKSNKTVVQVITA